MLTYSVKQFYFNKIKVLFNNKLIFYKTHILIFFNCRVNLSKMDKLTLVNGIEKKQNYRFKIIRFLINLKLTQIKKVIKMTHYNLSLIKTARMIVIQILLIVKEILVKNLNQIQATQVKKKIVMVKSIILVKINKQELKNKKNQIQLQNNL